uniref:Uncharacterized protein n=1 Tax=Oryza sativa subsp. japonica TaxID=39947 RepID=Q6K628_ORYSJ|nr:hypothetical protein [Oryza sativa Japonica Group]
MPIMNSFIDIFENFVQYNNEIYFRQWEHSKVSGCLVGKAQDKPRPLASLRGNEHAGGEIDRAGGGRRPEPLFVDS